MKRGISFELPNDYGSFFKDILHPINIKAFKWHIDNVEAFASRNGSHTNDLFPHNTEQLTGSELKEVIETERAYVIFAELRAFQGPVTSHPETYEEFVASDCQLVLLIVDTIYTTIYCKDQQMLHALYENAHSFGFRDLEYLNEQNDARTRLSVW
ncbi:DUF2691 family protein [Planococcus sp. SIMBA_143]